MKQAILFLSDHSDTWTMNAFDQLLHSITSTENTDVYFAYHLHKGKVCPEILRTCKNTFPFSSSILTDIGYSPIGDSLVPGNNHFPLLYFFLKHSEYDYYWLVEDDVRFTGKWQYLLDSFADDSTDFISSRLQWQEDNPNWYWWYCTQHHKSTVITQEVMDLMVLHITRYILDNDIKSHRIFWFGGEPLLEPDAIDYVSSRVLAFCVQHGVDFRGQITTNGALLSEEVIAMLQRNRINDYQITLDGNRNHHNQVKRSDDIPSSFDLILNNIKNLLIHNSQSTVILRHNYTDKSLQDVSIVDDINKIIPRNLRSRIYIDLKRVWQIRESDIDMHRLHHLLLLFGESGYKLNTIGPLDMCYVDRKHFDTLYFDGRVGKCSGRPLKSLRGHLDEEGRAIWSEQLAYPSYDILENEKKCIECRYLPLCMGGCPRRREDQIKKNEPMECPEEKDLFFQHHNVLDLCWRQMINGAHSSH